MTLRQLLDFLNYLSYDGDVWVDNLDRGECCLWEGQEDSNSLYVEDIRARDWNVLIITVTE